MTWNCGHLAIANKFGANLFDRIHQPTYDSAMSKPFIIEELPHDPGFERLFAQAYRNLMWFSDHADELGVFKKHRGRYVAAAGGELFVADSREEVAPAGTPQGHAGA